MSRKQPIWGVDVSSHQGSVAWKQVAKEGFSFALAKATEGTYYADSYLEHNLHWSAERGLIPGAYHFLTNEDTDTQIARFLRAVGDPAGKLIALDVEDPRWYGRTGNGAPGVTDVWNAVHALYEEIGPHPILVYSGNWYFSGVLGNPDIGSLVNTKGVSLWVSRYVTGTGYASSLYGRVPNKWWDGKDLAGFGGHRPTILQFTESARVAGQLMDADAYAGSMASLKKLAGMGTESGAGDYYVQARVSNLTKDRAEELAAGSRKAGWTATVGKA